MAYPLLLDEMFSASIAERLSTTVTTSGPYFVPLDALHRSTGRTHAGIVLVPSRTFPQDRSLIGAIVDSPARLLKESGRIGRDQVVFLRR
ncbi:MAG TPA: hypothetical protein VFX70_02380 [Mycobacteriales bacterium]|nr:hypothetical protein [Mycobacteriales bacterium]